MQHDLKDNAVIVAGNLIKILSERNIKLRRLTRGIIVILDDQNTYYLKDVAKELNRKDRVLSRILDYIDDIYEFYDPELSKEYVVECLLDYDEIKYLKAKIIGHVPKSFFKNKNLDVDDLEGIINSEEFIASVDLNTYRGNKVNRAMQDIKKEFPDGTKFILAGL